MIFSLLLACGPKAPAPAMPELPTVPAPKAFTPPAPSVTELPTGSDLWILEDHRLPLIVFKIVLPGGGSSDPSGQWGRADLVSEMLSESVGELNTLSFAALLNTAAASYSVSTYRTSTVLTLALHRDSFPELLPVIADAVYRPAFTAEDWDRVLENQVNSLKQMQEDARMMTSQYTGYFYHGPEHPLGKPLYGTVETVAAVDREASLKWHQARLVGEEISFAIAGDIAQEEAAQLLVEHFPSWPGTDYVDPPLPEAYEPANGKIFIIDMPGAQQTMIRMSSNAYPKGSEQAVPAQLAGIVMGGSFTSRLNSLLREEKGYTYGIGCYFGEGFYGNSFGLGSSVRTDATAPALQDIVATLATAGDVYTPEEVSKGKTTLRTSAIEGASSLSSIASEMVDNILLDRAPDYGQKLLSKVQEVTGEEMSATGALFQPNRGMILMAGDAAVISEPLKEAGFAFEIVETP